MPLPFLPIVLGGAAAAAGVAGVATAVDGASKIIDANDTMKDIDARHKENIKRLEMEHKKTTSLLDEVGKKELEILKSFNVFSELIEKIHNKPQFASYKSNGITIPPCDIDELKKVSLDACELLSKIGVSGASVVAGGSMFGTLGTGYGGTLAALGGGSLASGGGGVVLGSTVLGATTLGAGVLVGGLLVKSHGEKLEKKAENAYNDMKRAEININWTCNFLNELYENAKRFNETLTKLEYMYKYRLYKMQNWIENEGKTDWFDYNEDEKMTIQNTILLVGILYKMCQTNLVLKDNNNGDSEAVNFEGINEVVISAEKIMREIA